MEHRIVTLTHGDQEYTALLDRIRADTALVAAMEADAESHPDELDVPGTWWSVALVERQGVEVPAAWCAARVEGDLLKAHSNYEHPDHRGHGLYAAAYRERHRSVVVPSGLPTVTYLFPEPIALHEADGWVRTGVSGVSEMGHQWAELRRPA
jgi:hypothetical protein